jgi:hypothetical protein
MKNINIKNKYIIFEKKTSETVFVKNECSITPFLLTHTLNDLFDLQDELDPPPNAIPTTIHLKKIKKWEGGGWLPRPPPLTSYQ